jgi:DNA topoisomerase-1
MSEFIDDAIAIRYDPLLLQYKLVKNNSVLCNSKIKRIHALAIPTVYKEVWLAKSKDNKIQAVALDGKGKKQYFYSKEWNNQRQTAKGDRLREFLDIVPKVAKTTRYNKQKKGWGKTKTMSYMLDIVMDTNIRVGNMKYLQANNSFGLTTLKKEHLRWSGNKALLDFRGKHGVQQHIEITNKSLTKFLHAMEELPEDWLMKYQSQDGKYYRVNAQDLNTYLHSIAGPSFTIKDYRTWGANITFVETLSGLPLPVSPGEVQKNISLALEAAAGKLGNTKATSKKSYVMDELVGLYTTNPDGVVKLGVNIIK